MPLQELAKLRAALQHLLSGEKGSEQQLPNVAFETSTGSTGRQGSWQDATAVQPQHKSCTAVGCFGLPAARMNWNGFQKACKGQGLTKAELSAAWQQYKSTGQIPGQQHMLEESLEKVARSSQQGQQPKLGKWGTIKEWVRSRTSSRATSRVVSPSETPQPSPGVKAKPAKPQQEIASLANAAAGNGFSVAIPVDAGCVAVSAACMEVGCLDPASSAEVVQQQQLIAMQMQAEQQQQQLPAGEQHHNVAAASAAAPENTASWHWTSSSSSTSSRPFSSLTVSSSSTTAAAPATRCRAARELVPHDSPGLLDQFGPWMPASLHRGRLKQLKTAIPAKPGLYEWGVRLPAGTTTADLAGAAAAAASIQGDGSSRWDGVRTRSGLHTGAQVLFGAQAAVPEVEYGPVICFYLGKAGASWCRDASFCAHTASGM